MESLEKQWNLTLDQATTIDSLMQRYPDLWNEVKGPLGQAIRSDRPDHLNELLVKADATARHWSAQVASARGERNRNRILTRGLPQLVRSRMVHLSLKKILTEKSGGPAPMLVQSARDKWLCNMLIYLRYRDHRPVNALAMRLLWPLVKDPAVAMGVAKELGFYCFYTDRFLKLLKRRTEGKKVLEIAAGSGVLTLLAQKYGIDCVATDDRSWGHAVRYGRHVENLDAAQAIAKYQPSVVMCSWPPPNNSFEKSVFVAPSVEQYVVIGSKHQFATGARQDYASQERFRVKSLSDAKYLIAPVQIDSEILWFQ